MKDPKFAHSWSGLKKMIVVVNKPIGGLFGQFSNNVYIYIYIIYTYEHENDDDYDSDDDDDDDDGDDDDDIIYQNIIIIQSSLY